MKITLKDISIQTGISIPTVSRILSRTKLKNTKKENKVILIARKLGYPYIKSDQLSKKEKHIALITEVENGEFYTSLFRGMHDASLISNTKFSLISIKNEKDPINQIIESLQYFDGCCIFIPSLNDEDYRKIIKFKIDKPIISLAPIPNPIIDTISFDSYRGGFLVAKYFNKHSYNDVGIILGPKTRIESNNRKNGFIDYIYSKSSMRLNWSFKGDYSIESGHNAYRDLKKNNICKISIFSSNDSMAIGFIKEAQKDGAEIPKNIKICGYDNLPICQHLNPTLTSVSTNFLSLGKQVINIINNKLYLENCNSGHVSLIPVGLVERRSTQ